MFNTSRIELERSGSQILSLLLVVTYAIALMGVYLSGLYLIIKCVLSIILAWDAYRVISLHAALSSTTAVTQFLYHQGECVLFRRDGTVLKAQLLETKRLSRALISITVCDSTRNKRRHLLVARDSVSPQSFHQLCLMIRLRLFLCR